MKINDTWITLNSLRLRGRHGVLEQERTVGGDFVVSVSLRVVTDDVALLRDDLEGTVNYADVYHTVKETFDIPSQLLEHVARRMAEALLARFPRIATVRLTIEKVAPPMQADCRSAAFTLEAER